jgi:hypothetical protein
MNVIRDLRWGKIVEDEKISFFNKAAQAQTLE